MAAIMAIDALCGPTNMKITFHNSAHLQNITNFLNSLDTTNLSQFELTMHPTWAFVHPSEADRK
jgi:hypothetical protein